MSCYAVLHFAVLFCAGLCFALLCNDAKVPLCHYAMPCHAMLYHAMLSCAMPPSLRYATPY